MAYRYWKAILSDDQLDTITAAMEELVQHPDPESERLSAARAEEVLAALEDTEEVK